MFNSYKELESYCKTEGIEFIDFKVIDLVGRWHHLTIPVSQLTEKIIDKGIGMAGSSYGFLSVEKSDMVFKPDISTAFVDPFAEVPMISIISNIHTAGAEGTRFAGDPRFVFWKQVLPTSV